MSFLWLSSLFSSIQLVVSGIHSTLLLDSRVTSAQIFKQPNIVLRNFHVNDSNLQSPFNLSWNFFKLFSFWTSWRLICIILLQFRYPPFIAQSNRQKQQMIMAVSHQTIYILLKRNMYMLTRCSYDSSVFKLQEKILFPAGRIQLLRENLEGNFLISQAINIRPPQSWPWKET